MATWLKCIFVIAQYIAKEKSVLLKKDTLFFYVWIQSPFIWQASKCCSDSPTQATRLPTCWFASFFQVVLPPHGSHGRMNRQQIGGCYIPLILVYYYHPHLKKDPIVELGHNLGSHTIMGMR